MRRSQVGLLRLRKCSENTYRPELVGGASIVRELHVYVVPPTHQPLVRRLQTGHADGRGWMSACWFPATAALFRSTAATLPSFSIKGSACS